jgi:hypothetical protein
MAGIGKMLGNLSPLGGAITGKGMFGRGLAAMGDTLGPYAGPLSMLASNQRGKLRDRRAVVAAEEAAAADAEASRREAIRRSVSGMKKGGKVKKMAKGGSTASKRADGCATKGKTKGKMV